MQAYNNVCWHTYRYFDREKIIFHKHDRNKVGSLRMQELRYRFFILLLTSIIFCLYIIYIYMPVFESLVCLGLRQDLLRYWVCFVSALGPGQVFIYTYTCIRFQASFASRLGLFASVLGLFLLHQQVSFDASWSLSTVVGLFRRYTPLRPEGFMGQKGLGLRVESLGFSCLSKHELKHARVDLCSRIMYIYIHIYIKQPPIASPITLYLNSSLLATFYTLSFIDYVHDDTHLLTLLNALTLLTLLTLFTLLINSLS